MNRFPTPPTPLPPSRLLDELRQVRGLLDELDALLDLGLPPALAALRLDVEVALEQPRCLESARNQLDFIEELSEATWGLAAAVVAGPPPRPRPAGRRHREAGRLAASWKRLDRLSEELCREAEAWHRRRSSRAGG